MSAHRRREQDRKRARRARRRAERERSYAVAVEAMRVAREERFARLGPLVEMYGEGSQLLRMIDAALREQVRDRLPEMVAIAAGESTAPTRARHEILLAPEWR